MTLYVFQSDFRIRTDATAAQGGTPVWAAAEGISANVPPNIPFRIRFALSNDDPHSPSPSVQYAIYASKNGGAYDPLVGSDCSFADATYGASADGQGLTTTLMPGAAGTFSPIGMYCSHGISPFAISLPSGYFVEMEFGLQFNSPTCDGNTYQFQIFTSSGEPLYLGGFVTLPLFQLGNTGAASPTEADDVLTGAMNVPRAGRLDALEVSDALSGSAVVVNNAALTKTESNDTLFGSAYEGFVAYLTQTEADDSLIGVGSVTGVVSSLIATEDDDVLVSATLLWANQWIEVEGCPPSMWTPVECGESLPPFPPVVPPGGGGGGEVTVMELTMEQLPVLSLNQIGNFSHTPNMELCTLTVDGRPFFPVGSPPDFSVSGRSITWLSSIYSVDPSSTVIAQYSWISNG